MTHDRLVPAFDLVATPEGDRGPALVEVIVGHLVTLRDGFECRMGPDRTRAENYAIQQRALSVEEMFVRRHQP